MTQTLPRTLTKPRKAARGVVEPPPVALPAFVEAPPCVLGADVSITATGIAWPDGHINTHGRDGLTGAGMTVERKAAALEILAEQLWHMTSGRTGTNEVRLIMVEMLPTTGTRVHSERCYLWWHFVRMCTRFGVPVVEVPPTCLKLYITGIGDANKREVLASVQQHLPQFDIRRHGKTGKPLKTLDDNRADAAVLCAMGCELLGHPLCVAPGRRALDKIQLPEGINR